MVSYCSYLCVTNKIGSYSRHNNFCFSGISLVISRVTNVGCYYDYANAANLSSVRLCLFYVLLTGVFASVFTVTFVLCVSTCFLVLQKKLGVIDTVSMLTWLTCSIMFQSYYESR